MRAFRSFSPCLLLALSAAPAFAEKVWVVDKAMGPGAHFAFTDNAMFAAAPGDILLLRTGEYNHLDIVGKAVAVVADIGAVVSFVNGVHIQDVPAGPPVVLRGVEIGVFSSFGSGAGSGVGLEISNCDAPVWVEDCTIEAGWPALLVADSDDVVLADLSVTGGYGLAGFIPSFDPGFAVDIRRSTVTAHRPHFVGGRGANGSSGLPSFGGWEAEMAVRVEDATLHVVGGSIIGGKGGEGAANPFGCLDPGPGAPALLLALSATPNHVTLLGTTVLAGEHGDPLHLCPPVTDFIPPFVVEGGTLDVLGGTPAVLMSPPTAREATTLPLSFAAAPTPGQFAVLVLSTAQTTLDLATLGTLSLADPFLVPLGPIAPDGTLAVAPSVPPIPSDEGLRLYLQSLTCDTASCLLGTATHVVLLDAAL